MLMGQVKLSKKTLREQVADDLKRRILSGQYKPGERIVEAEISEAFEISRGPVREALRQLEEEGLITYLPNKGCEVKTLSYRDIQESYLIRSTLEGLAVKIYSGTLSAKMHQRMEALIEEIGEAAQKLDLYGIIQADEEFHACIIKEAGCDRLYRIWKSLESANAATYFTMKTEALMPYDVLQMNHRFILEGFDTGNLQEICKRIEDHYMIVPQVLYESSSKAKGE